MNSAKMDKLYSKLTPFELGTMAFDAIARLDENEAELIVNSVEWLTYRSVHTDYRRRVERLVLLASSYSIEHWRTRALMYQACVYCLDDISEELDAFGIQCFKRLTSIEVALIEVCKAAKVDIESVKTFACNSDFKEFSELVEPDLVAEYVGRFGGILDLGG